MSRIKNPTEKKRIAYEQDHRYHSGEPPKAWRRNKPLKKAYANRAFRKANNDVLRATLNEEVATTLALRKAGSLIKKRIIDWGPIALKDYVASRLAYRKSSIGAKKRRRARALKSD